MFAQIAVQAHADLQTILSSEPATFLPAPSLPELDIFGHPMRLLLINEPSKPIRVQPRLAARARYIATFLADRGVMPVLVTAEATSLLVVALRNAGWGILMAPSTGSIDRAPQSKGGNISLPAAPGGARYLSLFCALWQCRERSITVIHLAVIAEVSPPIARRFLSEAVAGGWVGQSRSGREYQYRVEDRRELVARFQAMVKTQPRQWQCFSVKADIFAQLPRLLVEFSRLYGLQYAATDRYAANFYLSRRHTATELRLRIAPLAHLSSLLTHLRATPVQEASANLKIIVAMETASWLFRAQSDGLHLANPMIVAADLTCSGDPMADQMTAWLCG